jgi:putative nucleotidyltransferase with HDIG domain
MNNFAPTKSVRKEIEKTSKTVINLIFVILTTFIMAFPYLNAGEGQAQTIGDVSESDVHAPYTLTYQSLILTDNAKELAANNVTPIYLEVDPTIAKKQIERLQILLNYIDLVRNDVHASNIEKVNDLQIIPEFGLTNERAQEILALSNTEWESIRQESVIVLEQVMRNTIREYDVSTSREEVPILISYTFSQPLSNLIENIVSPLVIANSLYDAASTEEARRDARDSVDPVTTTYVTGQNIISQGEIITPLIWEALEQYNLVEIKDTTRDLIASIFMGILASVMILILLANEKQTKVGNKVLSTVLLMAFFLIYLTTARLFIPDHAVLPYIYPIVGFGLAISYIYSINIGIITTTILSILCAYTLPMDMSLTAFYFFGSIVSIYILGDGRRISRFIESALVIGVVGTAIIVAYRLPSPNMDWVGILTLTAASFGNGILSSILAIFFRFLLGKALNVITPLELLDLSRPDHPLLQHLLSYAPGSYQHSLQVANLAEQAARVIGADALLTRVGALYHDIGKADFAQFFIENQLAGQENPHDELSPLDSSKTIQNHITRGAELAKQYHLPAQIQAFILEHHGTNVTNYQYIMALNEAEDPTTIVKENFQYPGPEPQSRETALVMLADGCEARSRAELPANVEELRKIIADQIEKVRESGQLNFTELTLNDLRLVQESFVKTLMNMQHGRIKYPKRKAN